MDKLYFVMLNHQRSDVFVPLVNDDGDPIMFATKPEAREAAEGNMLGVNFGYEIFTRGEGES